MRPHNAILAALIAAATATAGCLSILDIDNEYREGTGGSGGGGSGRGGSDVHVDQGSSGGHGAGGQDGGCTAPGDCPTPANGCLVATCEDGRCTTGFAAAGTPAGSPVAGDCKQEVCDGAGAEIAADEPTDVLDDGRECSADTCEGGSPVNTNLPAGEACPATAGMRCDGAGACVECTEGSHCESGLCGITGMCLGAACGDHTRNGNETGVDCGGACGATCPPGDPCGASTDCLSRVCEGGICSAATCDDGVRNGDETDVDCGGGCMQGCGPLAGCTVNEDCAGNDCSGTSCVPNCQDGVRNNAETAVDCGGPSCADCGIGQTCGAGTDCQTGFCADGVCCTTACGVECMACVGVKTGRTDGTCAPIPSGEDPDLECAPPQPGLPCGNSTGLCSGAGSCQRYPAGTACGDAATCVSGSQTNQDHCNGVGTCVDSGSTPCGAYACGATVCRTVCASDAECATTAYCSGGSCYPKKVLGTSCGGTIECASGNCVDGVCCDNTCGGGAANDCQACNLGGSLAGICSPVPSGTITCRASTGLCDPAETCNGTSAGCPADSLSPGGTTCRASAGTCDPAETCNGTSAACPTDSRSPGGTQCRASAGTCDPAETCNGTSAACPADILSPGGTQCRASAGACDVAETCTGTSVACPADILSPGGTQCRASADACDVAETCTGTSAACPTDILAPGRTQCRASAGACDMAESCTGTSAACPTDLFVPAGYACGDPFCSGRRLYEADVCDGEGYCLDGGSFLCIFLCEEGACISCAQGTSDLCLPPSEPVD